jgi:hypothetical protein
MSKETTISVRVDNSILKEIDKICKPRKLARSSWVYGVVLEIIQKETGKSLDELIPSENKNDIAK